VDRPVLALVGHGTDTSEGLEPGIHLRWAFRREIGFPQGGFCIFRRDARRPPMKCFGFGRVPLGARNRVTLSSAAGQLLIESEQTMRVERARVTWPLPSLNTLRELHLPLPREGSPVVLRPSTRTRVVVPPTPLVLIQVAAPRGRRISAVAYGLGRQVARIRRDADGRAVIALRLEADLIDAVEIAGSDLKLVRVCVALPESCESTEGWQPVSPCPLCLPITHRAYACSGRGCDEEDARARLPKDPCVRAQYDGANLDDLLQTVRAAVDPARGLTMASRLPDLPASNEDCPPPDTEAPDLHVGALDVLLMAAVDPMVARMLGLYHVDASAVPGRRYDYKIVGEWPEGTLWSLENTISFDEREPGEAVSGAWSQDGVAFLLNRSARVVTVPTNFAGTTHALSVQPDVFDWASFFSGSDAKPRLALRFAKPVGEVQVYARHGGATLRMRASRDGTEVAVAESVSPEAVLATHAPGGIDTLLIEGELQMLLRVDWETDYIAHGRHCHIAYGLSAGPPTPLAVPDNVRGIALHGVTRKEGDCEPLGEGALADTRHLVGVRWLAPAAPDGILLARDPVRFRVERANPDTSTVLVGREDLLTVTPPDESFDGRGPLDWPAERQHAVDVVPHPGAYRYRVEGSDIFGRRSGFGPWSDPVDVQAVAPPPPSKMVGKWLDPGDPYLTAAERALVEDGQAGLLVRWEWLDSQERQAPFTDSFQVLLERGWLNLVQGTAVTDPAEGGGDSFTVDVVVDRALTANALAGMTMSRDGTPYRIRSSTATDGAGLFLSTLECAEPASGLPAWGSGSDIAIPLLPAVRCKVEGVDLVDGRTMRVLIGDLRAIPAGGLVGGAVLAGAERWPIVNATGTVVTGAGLRVSLKIAVGMGLLRVPYVFGLLHHHVTIELPPPVPPYVDYRNPGDWRSSAGPVPSEGPGEYEVFIRQAVGAETPGRTSLAPRRHRILSAAALLDTTPTAYGQVAVASVMAGVAGSASAAASFVHVDRTAPAAAAALPAEGAAMAGDIPPVYASPPDDYSKKSSFAYRWSHMSGMGYAVHRALDEALFAIDRRVRDSRSKARAEWNAFLNQFPDPEGAVRDVAFDVFIRQANPPDYAGLSPRNRLLQILASFTDVAEAFARLNPELIEWDDTLFADRATQTPGPGETPYVPQPANRRLYIDRSLPVEGTSAYFYRVRSVDAFGNAGVLSISTPPVWLLDDTPPRAPAATSATGGAGTVALNWWSNREPDLREYRVYRTSDPERARDVRFMDLVTTLAVPAGDPAARPAEVSWEDPAVVPYADLRYRLAAVDTSGNESSPSAPLAARAFSSQPPEPPAAAAAWTGAGAARVVRVTWPARPGVAVLVERAAPGGAAWRTIGWTAAGAGSADDSGADPAAGAEYRLRARDASGRQGPVTTVVVGAAP
jgi:hypothetical protein